MHSLRGLAQPAEQRASLFSLFLFLEYKSEIAHRYNDLKEETFKAV